MSCEWLTASQAGKALSVSSAAIYRWIRQGKMTYYKTPGGGIRICKADLVLPENRPTFPVEAVIQQMRTESEGDGDD